MQITKSKIVEFLAIEFTNPNWEFGAPVFLLKPVLRYGTDNDITDIVESCEMDLLMGDEIEDEDGIHEDAEWNGTSISALKRAAREILNGKPTLYTKDARVLYKKNKFYYIDEDESEIEMDSLEEKDISARENKNLINKKTT